MSDAVSEIVMAFATVPPAAVMLGGGLLLLRNSPRLGRRAYWAGVGLVALFCLLALAMFAHRAGLQLLGAGGITLERYFSLSYAVGCLTMTIAAAVCVLTVRAAARAQRLD